MKKLLKRKPCWEVIQCKAPEKCASREQKDIACWEAALQQNDYRSALNICQDCIVYLLRKDKIAFTKQEVSKILQERKCYCNLG